MSMIYADQTQSRFFLIPEEADAQLPAGSFAVKSLTGTTRQLDEAALAQYEIPSDEAKRQVGAKVGVVRAVIQEIQTAAAELLTDLSKAAEPGGRLNQLLSALGVTLSDLQRDTTGTVGRMRERLMSMSQEKLESLRGPAA